MPFATWLAGGRILASKLNDISGIWTAYTPVWSVSSGAAPSVGNGSLVAERSLNGGTCHVRCSLVFGSSTTPGGGIWQFSLPFTAATLASAQMGWMGSSLASDPGAALYPGVVQVASGASIVTCISPATASGGVTAGWNSVRPFTWATGDYLSFSLTYQYA
ncbi:hypothetical protein ACFVZH_22370 [Streptomyces sp. NPDC059534]|uniref:hypothetical protein n=1 Tax=Streptomyces sp. NPDC059534 TaxID=3346859 RepID=UPI0036897884